MSETKYQFQSLEEYCSLIKNNIYTFKFPKGNKHVDVILRLVNDLSGIASNGYHSQCKEYEQEKRSKEEYKLMLQTCWMYFDLVQKEIHEYCQVLPANVVQNWGNLELIHYGEKIRQLSGELESTQNMYKIMKEKWSNN
jgi:hypothetical protein